MSSNYSSTCSKSYYPLCILKCRACSGRCPRSARRFNGGSSEKSRRPDFPSMWSGGREARAGGGRGFCWAKKVRSQLGIGLDGEISCAPILCYDTSLCYYSLLSGL